MDETARRAAFDEIGHECGFALLRLLKPPEYYYEKYGTQFFGVNRMHLLMEKQRNRGQDGAGVANVKLDMPPGSRFIHCEKSIAADPINDLFRRVEQQATQMLQKAPKEARIQGVDGKSFIDPRWVKDNIPFCGELFLAHVRYGTDSENSIDRCHPVTRESNWMTRNLILAGNFNITNNEDLFASLVQLGQHPRELSDTVMLLEKIGHFVDKENNDLYVKYSAAGHNPQTCFSLIAENLNVPRILRRASSLWDGGYCIAGLLGHGDSFVMRDPSGIRPAFYYADDEIITVCSEAPLIQTVFNVTEDNVHPLPPGQALCISRSGSWTIEKILQPLELKQCSFERIYFSRGNDAKVYREREELGRLLLQPLLGVLKTVGCSLANSVLSYIPNTSELAFHGLAKEAQDHLDRLKVEAFKAIAAGTKSSSDPSLAEILAAKVRCEKVVHKDAKIRTFIQEDASREHLTMHAYDVHYGTIRRGQDCIVALDDSIVRGNTLKNAILRTLDKMGPTKIVVVSSCPQIRFPDVYGIDMAKLGDLAAFKAAVGLLRERNASHVLNEVYRRCREELAAPMRKEVVVNHVKAIYEMFTPEEISVRIAKDVRPDDCKADVSILYQTVEDLHRALPEHSGDWYFTGDYPTPGGARVCCRAFALWMEGSSQRCYGISSALSFMRSRRPALVLGSGAREHALAWKLSMSAEVSCIFVAPGNGGISSPLGAESLNTVPTISVDVPVKAPHFAEIISFCQEQSVGLVVVGPEQMLADGIADRLRAEDICVFGPSQAAAELEVSKAFAKEFMGRHNIPTAAYKVFKGKEQLQAAYDFIDSASYDVVVKASGLAAGKGVVVPETKDEAKKAVRDCLEAEIFGAAGLEVVLEERMFGPECSVLALCDGRRFAVLPPAQDHKRVFDGDLGPNTGGMGAFAPTPVVNTEMMERIKKEILQPTIDGMRAEGKPFVGCLFAGLMITVDGPKVIEFNCRFGDPETEAVLPLIDGDLHRVLLSCALGELSESASTIAVSPDKFSVSVIMASGGYPGSYEKGHEISGIERAHVVPGVTVFHAGTTLADPSTALSSLTGPGAGALHRMLHHRTMRKATRPNPVVTSGGRVLAVTAVAHGGIAEARERAYVAVRSIKFQGSFYRKDIGASAVTVKPKRSSSMSASDLTARQVVRPKDSATYLEAGVDLDMDEAVGQGTKTLMLRTLRQGYEMSGNQGHFNISSLSYPSPMIVSSTNGVGTKLKVAAAMGQFKTIGTDLIALCANDVAARGAEPLFFSCHFSVCKLDAQQALEVNEGVADGCTEACCAFLESKTAEMPGVYNPNSFDLVGFAVGSAERPSLLPLYDQMQAGDVIVGLQSSGLHSNGFSLLRSVVQAAGIRYERAAPFDPTRSFGEVVLAPTRIYVRALLALARAGLLKGAAPITNGGLTRSIPRVLPRKLKAQLRADRWELPPVLRWLAARCKIPCDELAATFNCGVGIALVVAAEKKDEVLKLLKEHDEEAWVIGELAERIEGEPQVNIDGAESAWLMLPELGVSLPFPQVLSSLQDLHVTWHLVLAKAASDPVIPGSSYGITFQNPCSQRICWCVAPQSVDRCN
jgi:amidophosphoribosyltransferase